MILLVQVICWCILVKMNTLEDVPFQTLLGPLEEDVQLVTAPDITIPDCHRILRDTEVKHPSEHSHFFQFEGLSGINSVAAICLTQWLFRSYRVFLMGCLFKTGL